MARRMGNPSTARAAGVARDLLLAAAAAFAAGALLYAFAGVWPPLVSVGGHSMLPHLQPDDLVLVRGLDRVNVTTYQDGLASGYKAFQDYGDVIVYRPFGDANQTPVIHRAMYRVQEGQPLWPGGPVAPHAGYVTRGDNNFLYDQSSQISLDQPVEDDWILGVAEARVPLLGGARSLLGPALR